MTTTIHQTTTTTIAPAASRRRRPTVLMYHGFSETPGLDDPYDLSVGVDAFARQLAHLRTAGWTALDLDGYLHALDHGGVRGRSYLLTVDDALRSVHDHGITELREAGVPSVLFTPPGLLNDTTRWLELQPDQPIVSDDQLRELSEQGMEIGAHGWDHQSMIGMSDDELRRHTRAAAEAIADVVGRRPRAFAYPFGDYDERAIEAVRQAGYTVAFSVYTDDGRHAISRTDVKPADSMTAVRIKIATRAHYRVLWRAAGSSKTARSLVRRAVQRTSSLYPRR